MKQYQHLLVALDLSSNSEDTLKQALVIQQQFKAKLSIIHIVDPHPLKFYEMVELLDIEKKLTKNAEDKLSSLCYQFAIDNTHQHILLGDPKIEVNKFADNLNVDLIIVGNHSNKHLGSIAHAILTRANCDVMVIKS